MKIFYVCDRLACARCSPECSHTSDITHAVNFEALADGSMWEKLQGSRKKPVMGVDLAERADFTAHGNGAQAPKSKGEQCEGLQENEGVPGAAGKPAG